jgi:predicted enzyme related to lactoylglutathione lyase
VAITGFHGLIYTSEPEAVRGIFRDVFGWEHVDAGDGWLIFALPPAELAVHPSGESHHELYLMCADLDDATSELRRRGAIVSDRVTERAWGLMVAVTLPGGSVIQLYEPRHASPLAGGFSD